MCLLPVLQSARGNTQVKLVNRATMELQQRLKILCTERRSNVKSTEEVLHAITSNRSLNSPQWNRQYIGVDWFNPWHVCVITFNHWHIWLRITTINDNYWKFCKNIYLFVYLPLGINVLVGKCLTKYRKGKGPKEVIIRGGGGKSSGVIVQGNCPRPIKVDSAANWNAKIMTYSEFCEMLSLL